MVEAGEDLGLSLEPSESVGIKGERLREDLEGDLPVELRIGSPIHLAHAALADQGGDVIVAASEVDLKS